VGALGGALLGIGAAAGGAPQAGMAIAMGSQAAGLSNILQFSRTHEHEADRLALSAMHQANFSGQPMLDLFTQLRTDSQLSFKTPPPYLLTHPLPAQRITNLQQAVAAEKGTLSSTPPTLSATQWQRFQAKSYALSHTPAQTQRKYPHATDPAHLYARAIAYAFQGKTAQAQELTNTLLKTNPTDPFYIELNAYLAQDAGDLATATQLFTQVITQHPSFSFTRFALAENLKAQGNAQAALPHLQQVTREWPWWPAPWQSLGVAYGQLGQLANSHLAITEGLLRQGQKKEAEQQLTLANHYLKKSPNQLSQQWAESLQTQLTILKN
jgi:predicted Zn-dependent protease